MKLSLHVVCDRRLWCGTCRDKEGGRSWREDLAATVELPPDAPDFACPLGGEWGRPPGRGGLLGVAVHGAAGIAKAVLGIDPADDATQQRRRSICGNCEHVKRYPLGDIAGCALCGCVLWAKIKNASESCPANKWAAVPPD